MISESKTEYPVSLGNVYCSLMGFDRKRRRHWTEDAEDV